MGGNRRGVGVPPSSIAPGRLASRHAELPRRGSGEDISRGAGRRRVLRGGPSERVDEVWVRAKVQEYLDDASWPNCDAHIRGVDPFTSRSSASGRLLGGDSSSRRRSWRTRATSPQRAARCRGGEPRMSVVSRSDVNISGRLATPATSSDDAGASASASSVRTARDATARGDGRRALARTGANRSPASPGHARTRMDDDVDVRLFIRFSSVSPRFNTRGAGARGAAGAPPRGDRRCAAERGPPGSTRRSRARDQGVRHSASTDADESVWTESERGAVLVGTRKARRARQRSHDRWRRVMSVSGGRHVARGRPGAHRGGARGHRGRARSARNRVA